MSFRLLAGVLSLVCVVFAARPARAASITFTEQFIFPDTPFPPPGPPAGSRWFIGTDATFCAGDCLRTAATVLFDIGNLVGANPANQGVQELSLVSGGLVHIAGPLPVATQTPTTDASGFVSGTGLSGATITLGIRGPDEANDNVLVQAFGPDGSAILHQFTYTGNLGATLVTIPLSASLLAQLAVDGQFGIRVSSFGTDIDTHDFLLDSATLQATTVPEPGLLALLLCGAAAIRLRSRRM